MAAWVFSDCLGKRRDSSIVAFLSEILHAFLVVGQTRAAARKGDESKNPCPNNQEPTCSHQLAYLGPIWRHSHLPRIDRPRR